MVVYKRCLQRTPKERNRMVLDQARNKYLVNFWNRTILLCIPCIYTCASEHISDVVHRLVDISRHLVTETRLSQQMQRKRLLHFPQTLAHAHLQSLCTRIYRRTLLQCYTSPILVQFLFWYSHLVPWLKQGFSEYSTVNILIRERGRNRRKKFIPWSRNS